LQKEDDAMNQKLRIMSQYSIVAVLLLFQASCATTPMREVSLESTRQSLQAQYRDLLQTFDLHQGIFAVRQVVWDALSPEERSEFIRRCSQSRIDITGRANITIEADEQAIATYDGACAVFYGPYIAAAQQAASMVPAVTEASSEPILLSMPRPVYPEPALKALIEGTVLIEARVGPEGDVIEAHLVDEGVPLLNDAALDAARKARFRPLLAPETSDAWVRIPVRFTISGIRSNRPSELPEGNTGGGLTAMQRADPDIIQAARAGK
jgi:TonB family protein